MKADCMQFRSLLGEVLSGDVPVASAGGMTELGWHQHLLGCSSCRELLKAEEALDLLLGSLPRPDLPAELAQRVLARLQLDPLDALLDLDGSGSPAPAGLAERILVDARLDGLLESTGPVEVPPGLAERVLDGLQDSGELTKPLAPPRLRLVRGGRARVLQAAAAAVIAMGVGGLIWRSGSGPDPAGPSVASADLPGVDLSAVDDELLASLDLLEQLELAESLDPVALDALVYLDVSDEIVMDWGDDWLEVELDVTDGGERR